ncbi:MAG: hypothetical protein ACFFCY_14860 [Promethearchaeota archaeon]
MNFLENKRTMQVLRCRICHAVITDVEGIYQTYWYKFRKAL